MESHEDSEDSVESQDDWKEEGRIVAISTEMAVPVLRRLEFGVVSTGMRVSVLRRV